MSKCITTPIFYASGAPHLGHAYSAIIADTISQFYRLNQEKTLLISGTDENGQKIESTARSDGMDLYEFVNNHSKAFQQLWKNLNISFDQFIRTTCPDHASLVTDTWKKLLDNDDIYLGTYEGQYCIDCEQFYSQWQLKNDCCPIHKRPVRKISEPSYIFRLNKYRQSLLDFYLQHDNFLQPAHFKKDLIKYLRQPQIEDLSVSRVNVSWGIPVPNDPGHIIYVWIDALFSYITAIDNANLPHTEIENTIHVIGKDILQFHGIYWPALLIACDLPLPKHLVVHGWWTLEGDKISKSNPKTQISLTELTKLTTRDGLRYGLLRQKPLGKDGNFKVGDLVELINGDLCNNLGNLVKRHATLVNKLFNGHIENQRFSIGDDSFNLIELTNKTIDTVTQAYQCYNLQIVCIELNTLISETNAYIHRREPWRLGKEKSSRHVVETLCVIHAVLRSASILYSPIIPEICQRIQHQLKLNDNERLWPKCCQITDIATSNTITVFERIKMT